MITLAHGCKCSEPKVHPTNWQRAGASLQKDWYIHYRFHDPLFKDRYPKGKLVIVKGMNAEHTLEGRRNETRRIYKNEHDNLTLRAYNPITGQMLEMQGDTSSAVSDELKALTIDPQAPLIEALTKALELSRYSNGVKIDIRSVLKYFTQAAEQLRIHTIPICEVEKKHIRAALTQCGKIKTTWTANTFNYYKAHLSMLFTFLDDDDVITSNPVKSIKPLKWARGKRIGLTFEQRIKINELLRVDNFQFWLFLQIFYHSGARTTEILKVKKEDVDIAGRKVWYEILKGKKYRRESRPIKDVTLLFWFMYYRIAKPGQYLFTEGLMPGDASINSKQISRRWKTWVKNKRDAEGNLIYGTVGNWYDMKHMNSTETANEIGTKLAAKQNAHAEQVLKNFYDLDGEERDAALMRSTSNVFAPLV